MPPDMNYWASAKTVVRRWHRHRWTVWGPLTEIAKYSGFKEKTEVQYRLCVACGQVQRRELC